MLRIVTMSVILISLVAGNLTAQQISSNPQEVTIISSAQRLAVYPLSMDEISRRNRSRIRTKFQTILRKRSNYYVLGPDQVKIILQSQGLNTKSTCVNIECLANFGKNVEVDFAIGGEIKIVPNGLSIYLILVSSSQSKQMNSISKTIRGDLTHLINNEIPPLIDDLLDEAKNQQPASLTVKSDADSSAVYVDGILVGKTPFSTSNISFGRHSIRVVNRKEFKERVEKIYITLNEPEAIVVVNFRFKLGKLYISGLPYGAHLTINDISLGEIPYKDTRVFWGEYNVTAGHIGYYDKTVITDVASYDPMHIEIVLERKSKYLAAFYSFVIPGMGQTYSEHWKRAAFFPIATSSAIVASVYMDRLYAGALKKYEFRRDKYIESLNVDSQIDINSTRMDAALDDANNKRRIGFIAMGVTSALWFISVADAFLTFPPAIRDPWESEKAKFPSLSYSPQSEALLLSWDARF